jgi:hypothetical protein
MRHTRQNDRMRPNERETDVPVVCTLDSATLATRREGLLRQLVRRAEHRDEQKDGYRFRFAPTDDVLTLIARVINAERRCCRFLRFRVTVEPAEGPVYLDLTGPAGTREFLCAVFDE